MFHRELAACQKCGANAQFRGIIYVLANLLGETKDTPLQEWPMRKNIFGLGMSDWSGYANLLRKKFSYENTFYNHEPRLDIMNLTEKYLGKYDFVISSDVFEHILPPLQQGFDNLFRLLKPGGISYSACSIRVPSKRWNTILDCVITKYSISMA